MSVSVKKTRGNMLRTSPILMVLSIGIDSVLSRKSNRINGMSMISINGTVDFINVLSLSI